MRFGSWKMVFMEQRCQGTLLILGRALHRVANSQTLQPAHRYLSKAYMNMAAPALMTQFLATFKDFPPRQKAASFTPSDALDKMAAAALAGKAAKSAA
jgi:hypothetical protein